MNTSFVYRSYVISHQRGRFIAQPRENEDFQIQSINMLRVTRAIDALWNALEGKIQVPDWAYSSDVVDLDEAKEAMLVVDHPGFPSFPLGPVVGEPVRAAA